MPAPSAGRKANQRKAGWLAPLPPRPPSQPLKAALKTEPEPEPELRPCLDAEAAIYAEELRVFAAEELAHPAATGLDHETVLYRFMCARDNVLEDAREMMRGRMDWSSRTQLLKVFSEWHPGATKPATGNGSSLAANSQSERASLAAQYFYAGVSGVTKAGEPLMVERLGGPHCHPITVNDALVRVSHFGRRVE